MEVKRIKCPKCGVILDVKNLKNETVKRFACPQCKTPLAVKFQQQPVNAGETQLAMNNAGATLLAKPGKLSHTVRLMVGDDSYLLQEGENIIGRKGKTSTATIQIATDDKFMSRQHCLITIKTLPDGSQKAVLSNYQNKNDILVKGVVVAKDDSVRLTDGDTIMMGHTTIVFKQ